MTTAGRAVVVDRAAYTSVTLVALTFGLGDIAQVTPLGTVVMHVTRGLLPLSIGLALLATLAHGRRPAFPRALALPTAAWLCVLMVSATVAPDDPVRTWSTLERPASGALLAWAICAVAARPGRWRRLASAVACGGLLVAAFGLAEATRLPPTDALIASLHDGGLPTADVPRITSTLSHPNLAAIVLELSLPLLVAWAWTAAGPWRVAIALAALGTLVALILTFSRAGLVAVVLGLVIMGIAAVESGHRRHALALALALAALPVTLILAAAADPRVDQRLIAGLDEATRLQPSRLVFWEIAREMQRDHPWLGLGPDNFRWQFAAYSGINSDNLGIHAHNQYLEAFADTGILGLVVLVWLLLALLRTALLGALRARHSADWAWRAAVLGSLCAWLLHAGLDDFERFWPASVAFWLLAGLSLSEPSAVEKPPAEGDDGDHDEQDQHPHRTRKRTCATAPATEAHHSRPLLTSRLARCQLAALAHPVRPARHADGH